ncbi:lantibiotic dehydratase [Streptacidiphilus sp. EB103A]|uniref:lantibiotic dehydratase n=1 Tax=Streptacidiphilus sp. EB103A TaxID=3156275 RepID=UPI003513B7F8
MAPYAVVRTVALSAPKPSPTAIAYREIVGRLVDLTSWSERAGLELCDTLHDLAGSTPPDVRSRVLVPLRRDVHNQRSPRPKLRAALADLPQHSPLLDEWLSWRDEIDRIVDQLDMLTEPALKADRSSLAELCRSEELQCAVALTSGDLLHAVQRAAIQGEAPDKQARKSEATVLRYAMRAVTKTSPLSWFSHVGWGQWREDDSGHDLRRAVPSAVARVERSTLEALVQAVLGRGELRAVLDHRLAPGLRFDGSHVRYRRRSPVDETSPAIVREEQVAVPLTAPLRHVLAHVGVGGTVRPHDLAAGIAARLPASSDEAERAAVAYVDGLIDQGLLQPEDPFDPQAKDIVHEATRWLVAIGFAEMAAKLADIGADTERYAQLPAKSRAECLARIRSRWAEAFSLVGAAPAGRRAPLTEDVATHTVTALAAGHGSAVLPDIVRLSPLFELFDGYSVARQVARDRFVARFGVGGSCDSLVEFADEITEAWRALDHGDRDSTLGRPDGLQSVSGQVQELLRLRAEVASAVPAAGVDGEAVLPEQLVADAGRRSPAWLRTRPTSYSVFVQPVTDAGTARLCVNHVYGGWGRFTSRFLDHLGPDAKQQVSAQIAEALGSVERVAQIRPVGGFNANLHPRLVADEVSEVAAWATLQPEQLELVHDTTGDQLRLRVAATGELINVLYLGFLMPFVLPGRWMPLVNDLGSGLVDLGGALARTQDRDTAVGRIRYQSRLRYRDVILSRARWRLPAETAHAWRADLDHGSPVQAASRWRALLGIPEHVFVSAAPPEGATGPSSITSFFKQPKSQYVDLGSALHVRCLSRTLARYPDSLIIEEALPEPEAGMRTVEIVAETYRSHP